MTHDPSAPILVYGHDFCPSVGPVLTMLRRSGAAFEYLNIHRDAAARQRVQAINGGYESVPTLVFPDGSTLTEPSPHDLARRLTSLGYRVTLTAWLAGYFWPLVIGIGVLLALLRGLGAI